MTDYTLARVDEVLTELVELVETARTIPMSASCVLPRERTLDLLDSLREVLPPEMTEARRLVAQRAQLIADAARFSDDMKTQATERAEHLVGHATEQAEQLVAAARTEAHQIVEAARAEQAQLVSAAGVHQAAVAEAARITAEAEQYAAATRGEAEQAAAATREQAEQYAERLAADAQDYASHTLTELIATLQRLLGTAENGLGALHRRES
jgi:cell division septum initiation protein DivIVA